jgi:mycobactin lysine-N-oxygenase
LSTRLAIIGGGAKAVAVAAKAAALRDMGLPAPDVVVVERAGIGANWDAVGGWTDGRHRLGTNPEKDVGFPYRSALAPGRNAELDERMLKYSWQAHLVGTGQFADWIDRGRPAPTHRGWAAYLQWVATEVGLNVLAGEVVRLSVDAGAWTLHTDSDELHADAVLITGPGHPGRSLLPGNPQVLSIAQFWRLAADGAKIAADRVALIGGGETTASMVDELFSHRVNTITVISPQPTLFTRGEGYFENRMFSDPTRWSGLTTAERRDVLARTDRGVFSARVQESLLADDRIRHLRGRVAHAVARENKIRITLQNTQPGEPMETVHGFDLVIDGSGVDPTWFVPLLSQEARDVLELGLGGPASVDRLQKSVGYDLALINVAPKLFLPNLSGLTQGPGFPNLSCLGLLSDRVLGAGSAPSTGAAGVKVPTTMRTRRSDEYQSV